MKIKNIFFIISLIIFSYNICLAMEETRCADLNIDVVAEQQAYELINFLRSDAGHHFIQLFASPVDDNMVCGNDENVEWQKRFALGEKRYHKLFLLKSLIQKNSNFFIEAEVFPLIKLTIKLGLMKSMLTCSADEFKKTLETDSRPIVPYLSNLYVMYARQPVVPLEKLNEDETKRIYVSYFFSALADLVWSKIIRSRIIDLFSADEINCIREKSMKASASEMAVKAEEAWNLFETIGRSNGECSGILALSALSSLAGNSRNSAEQCVVQ